MTLYIENRSKQNITVIQDFCVKIELKLDLKKVFVVFGLKFPTQLSASSKDSIESKSEENWQL